MKNTVWNDFIESLIQQHFEDYKNTNEYHLQRNQLNSMVETLTSNLTIEEKISVEDIVFETIEQQEHYADILYQQGMRDCISILKNLGVI